MAAVSVHTDSLKSLQMKYYTVRALSAPDLTSAVVLIAVQFFQILFIYFLCKLLP